MAAKPSPALMARWPGPWRALALPVGVAVALHALGLAGATLVESRRPTPALLTSGDDTPELLRFSRRASQVSGQLTSQGQAPNLSLVPLPLDSTLPPPPPDLAFLGQAGDPRRQSRQGRRPSRFPQISQRIPSAHGAAPCAWESW